jgi:transcriptional regulator with XRE-family HTH domain
MSAATIGSALVERRRELGLEKGQAADKIGMSRTTYSSYEQDAQRPSVDVFPALAGFLEVSIEELLDLYGATCVAAVRPALRRVLSGEPESNVSEERTDESSAATEALIEVESGAPYQSLTITSGGLDASEAAAVAEMPGVEATREASEPVEAQDSEVPLEWSEPDSVHSVTKEVFGTVEEPTRTASADVTSDPVDVSSSTFEDDEKRPGHKTKKKKKKKKKS